MNPPPGDRYLAIVNPAAGNGRCGRRAPAAVERLRAAGLEIDVRETAAPGEATHIAGQGLAAGYRRFLAGGGDGTSFEVVNGLLPATRRSSAEVSLGFLPFGTGNAFLRDYARDYREYALSSLIAGRRRPCDVLVLDHADGEHHLINLCGFGLSADAPRRSEKYKRWGPLAFIAGSLEAILSASPTRLPVGLDGGELVDAPVAMLCVCNSRYAGQMMMAPEAAIADGELDVIRAAPMGRWEMFRTLPKLVAGRHLEHPGITAARAREIRFELEDEVDVMADGELLRLLPRRIEVLPRALEVCV